MLILKGCSLPLEAPVQRTRYEVANTLIEREKANNYLPNAIDHTHFEFDDHHVVRWLTVCLVAFRIVLTFASA